MDDFLTDGKPRAKRNGRKEKTYLSWVAVIIGLLGIPILSPLYTFFYLMPLYLMGIRIAIRSWQKKRNTIDLIGILLNGISLLWTLVAWGMVISLWLGI